MQEDDRMGTGMNEWVGFLLERVAFKNGKEKCYLASKMERKGVFWASKMIGKGLFDYVMAEMYL